MHWADQECTEILERNHFLFTLCLFHFILFLSSTTFLPPTLLKFFLLWLQFNHSLSQDHCMLLCFFPTSFNINLFLWFISLSFFNLFYLFLPLLLTFLSLTPVHFSPWFWPLKQPISWCLISYHFSSSIHSHYISFTSFTSLNLFLFYCIFLFLCYPISFHLCFCFLPLSLYHCKSALIRAINSYSLAHSPTSLSPVPYYLSLLGWLLYSEGKGSRCFWNADDITSCKIISLGNKSMRTRWMKLA